MHGVGATLFATSVTSPGNGGASVAVYSRESPTQPTASPDFGAQLQGVFNARPTPGFHHLRLATADLGVYSSLSQPFDGLEYTTAWVFQAISTPPARPVAAKACAVRPRPHPGAADRTAVYSLLLLTCPESSRCRTGVQVERGC